ncbi:hypothetical protein NL676_021036 [Syzygium grande]|nr:hypothetical protein NL676_021036 [Syzygium grande]
MVTGRTSSVQTANAYARLDGKMWALRRRLETLVSQAAMDCHVHDNFLGLMRPRSDDRLAAFQSPDPEGGC